MTLRIGDWCSGGTGGEGYLLFARDEVCFSSFSFSQAKGVFSVPCTCLLCPSSYARLNQE